MFPMRLRYLLAASFVCFSTMAMAASDTPAGMAGLTRGTVSDNAYVNEYFNIRMGIPEGWAALTDDEFEGLSDERLAEEFRALRAGAPIRSLRTLPLAMLVQPRTGANVIVIGQPLNGRTESDASAIASMNHLDARTRPGVKTVSGISTVALGGKTFRRFDMVKAGRNADVRQSIYMATFGDYFIMMITTARANDEKGATAALEGLTFTSGTMVAQH